MDVIQYKSAALKPLPWWDDDPKRDARGRFRPQWAPDGLCDRVGCYGRRRGRFCDEHRREHGERLMGQLQAIIDARCRCWCRGCTSRGERVDERSGDGSCCAV